MEPLFLRGADHAFRINTFYADILGVYDDGVVEDALRPWRLRQLQDQNVSKRAVWDSASKLAELDDQMGGREMPKRVVFDLLFDLGPLSKNMAPEADAHAKEAGSTHWRIHVKAYGLIAEASAELPVRVSSYGREDPDDLYEVLSVQQLHHATTGEVVPASAVEHVYAVGDSDKPGTQVSFTDDELVGLRRLGLVPGLQLLGFKDRKTLHFYENIKHAYFLYPSDLERPGSKRIFTALLHSMLAKNKVALTLFLPRENAVPSFAVLLPQAEELDEDGSQCVPPGLHLIVMPYMDDIRDPPPATSASANADEVAAAGKVIESFHRKDPFNPDVYANPALQYHYGVLMAQALGHKAPEYHDTTCPDYELIEQVGRATDAALARRHPRLARESSRRPPCARRRAGHDAL